MVENFVEIARECALTAGNIALAKFGKTHNAQRKADSSWFTEIDVACEEAIKNIIFSVFPEHRILGEESGYSGGSSEYVWMVDPLDGTHNYMYGIPMFGSSVALVHNDEPVAGAICLPLTDELYTAEKGKGAFFNGKSIHVSSVCELHDTRLLLGARFSPDKKSYMAGRCKKLLMDDFSDIRMLGCSVRTSTLIARGDADVSIATNEKPWDIAAGYLLMEEAGGRISQFDGNRWTFGNEPRVASNGVVHEQILKFLAEP